MQIDFPGEDIMKTFLLYLKLIGVRILQGLQKVMVIGCGIVGAVTIWNIASGYFKSKQTPSFKDIMILLICIVIVIVLLTLKNIIESKLSEIDDNIKHRQSLKKHKNRLIRENEHRKLEQKVEQETFQANTDPHLIKKFETEKIKKEDIQKLDTLIGLAPVKKQLKKMKATVEYEKSHGGVKNSSVFHMKFIGNPGTGKTTVAKAVAAILYDAGVIQKPKYITVSGNDLMGTYTGTTAPTINALFKQAEGGLLFIDEAYALAKAAGSSYGDGYAHEAVSQLLMHLENHDSKTVVIFGGYKREMEQFFNMNPGLNSRVPLSLDFPDYTPEELLLILEINLKKYNHTLTDELKPILLNIFRDKIFDCECSHEHFSNGRYARNVADELHQQHAMNYVEDNTIGSTIIKKDIIRTDLLNLN